MYAFAGLLNRLALIVASLFMIAVFVVSALTVFFRYVVQHSLPWSDELAAYLFIWMIFLGAATEVWNDGHPQVSLLVNRLSDRQRALARIVKWLAVIAWGCVLLVNGWTSMLAERTESWSSVPDLPLAIVYAAIPVCGVLIIFFAIGRGLERR
ncbi:MAG: 2,3-diketo-L-gulonate TRAP transporter small permease YiaM [Candidatus Velthaea sp.]